MATAGTESKGLTELTPTELVRRDRVYFMALQCSTRPFLEALRGKTLSHRDAVFLELARQKELMRRNTRLLSDVNAELAFRTIDTKRAELADKFSSLTRKERLLGLLRLMRFYVHTRHVNPIVGKPVVGKDRVRLPFRAVPCDGEEEDDHVPHEFCVNVMGERLVCLRDRQYTPCNINILATDPRQWKVEAQ